MKNSFYYTGRYALVQFFYWMNFVTVLGYVSMYLLDCGISNSAIGIIIGAAGIFAAIFQPLIASLADKPNGPSVKSIAVINVAISLIFAILLFLFHGKSALLSSILFGLLIAFLQFLLPFINALGTEMINQGLPINLGIGRGMGSVGYAVVSYIMGFVVAANGDVTVPISILIGLAAFLGALIFYPFKKAVKKPAVSENEYKQLQYSPQCNAASSPLAFVKKYPKFAILLVGMVCTYISHVTLANYLYQIIQFKGGGSAEMGTSMSICALVELPTLFLFSAYLKKAGCDTWLRICAAFMAAKAFLTILAPTIAAFYAIQLLQMFGWAVITIAPVFYVNSVIEPEDAIKGQAYMAMSYTIGSVLASFIGGSILDIGGVMALLIFSFVASVLGMIVILGFSEKLHRTKRES